MGSCLAALTVFNDLRQMVMCMGADCEQQQHFQLSCQTAASQDLPYVLCYNADSLTGKHAFCCPLPPIC